MHTDAYIEECVNKEGVYIYMESAQERDGGSERAKEREKEVDGQGEGGGR